MFGKRINLFKLLGFEVRVDLSWIVIVVLVTWSLSKGLFPFQYKGISIAGYWTMGIIGALGLFASIIFHELSHSLIARRYGLPMKGITLFIFGGVAEMSDEPPNPRAEFMMAIAGPLASILIGFIFFIIYSMAVADKWPLLIKGVFQYLYSINFLLAIFNMIPAFPLDGGRVLRSILWGVKGNLRWATRVSSGIGNAFGIFLIIMGILNILRGNFINGMWWALIGLFVQNAAKGSYEQLVTRKALEGETVRRFMKPDPITVTPSTTIEQLVEEYIYKHHFKMFPVVESENMMGCITTKQVKDIPKEEWAKKTVGDVVTTCSPDNTIGVNEDAVKALSKMNQKGVSRLLVTENNRLAGVISLKDLLEFLSLKVELEG